MVDFNKLNCDRYEAAIRHYKKLVTSIVLQAPVFISTDDMPAINIGISDQGRVDLVKELANTIQKLQEKIDKALKRGGG